MKKASKESPEGAAKSSEPRWSHSDAALLLEVVEKAEPRSDSDWNEVAKKLFGSVPRTGAACKKFFAQLCSKEYKEKSHWKEIYNQAVQLAKDKHMDISDGDTASEAAAPKEDSVPPEKPAMKSDGEELVFPPASAGEDKTKPSKAADEKSEQPKKRKRRTKKEMEEFRKAEEEKKSHKEDSSKSKSDVAAAAAAPKPSAPVPSEPAKADSKSDSKKEGDAVAPAEPVKRKAGRPPRSAMKTKPAESEHAAESVEEPEKKKRRKEHVHEHVHEHKHDMTDNSVVCEKLDTLTEMMQKLIDVMTKSAKPDHKHLYQEQPDGSSLKCTVCGFVRKL